jgi:hypothetical protein
MKQTYRGSCHCGKVQFEIGADLDHVRVCDCSICRRRGRSTLSIHALRKTISAKLRQSTIPKATD